MLKYSLTLVATKRPMIAYCQLLVYKGLQHSVEIRHRNEMRVAGPQCDRGLIVATRHRRVWSSP